MASNFHYYNTERESQQQITKLNHQPKSSYLRAFILWEISYYPICIFIHLELPWIPIIKESNQDGKGGVIQQELMKRLPGPRLNIYLCMAISMLKIRRPLGRLIFNMGIAIPGKTVFLIETAPRISQKIFLAKGWISAPMTHYLSSGHKHIYRWVSERKT